MEKGSRGEEKMRSGEGLGFVLHNRGTACRARTGIGFVSRFLAVGLVELGSFCVFWDGEAGEAVAGR